MEIPDAGEACRDLSVVRQRRREDGRVAGTRLFGAVFGGKVLAYWHQRLLLAGKARKDLRLRLRLKDPELWGWPWERLYDPDRGFLAVRPGTPVVRYTEEAAVAPLRVRPPLKILVVAASPRGLSPLSIEDELSDLERSLAELREENLVRLDVLCDATQRSIQERLKAEEFHVLHFIGHGAFDERLAEGVIYFQGDDGLAVPVDGTQLATVLLGQPSLRMVLLNVCNGAKGSKRELFSSLALKLVQIGIPAVIAMQSAVSDRTAATFARLFYESLAQRKPVDQAITEARNALFFLGSGEWDSPILVLRAPNGKIFELMWWEILRLRVEKLGRAWRQVLASILILVVAGMASWSFARRWADPNLLFAYWNPPECPFPPTFPIAFVKIEPSRGKPYCMARFEVTQRLWKRIMGKITSRRRGDALPVVRVSYFEAEDFTARMQKRFGGDFRLASNAEWQYAGLAGEKRPNETTAKMANCENPEDNDGFEGTAPVGSFLPNAWGLYDMAGNVSEWVDRGREGLQLRRGGSFDNVVRYCSVLYVTQSKPGLQKSDVGFRIVRDVVPTP